MSEVIDVRNGLDESTTQRIVEAVRGGELVVIPTDTSYAVICDAFHATAVTSLRMAKNQSSDVALPIAAASMATINGVAKMSPVALDVVAAFWPGPLTVLTAPQASLSWSIGSPDHALAVRVPRHDIALQVLAGIGPTVLTGAQQAGGKPLATIEQSQESLGEGASIYLDAGSLSGTVSSVLDATTGSLRLVREGSLTLAELRDVAPMIIKATSSS